MFQIRIHGRGGQGVVTGAELLSVAAFLERRSAQAFPSFGSERMGAPVTSFCRIDDREIRLREPIADPDALIIQDPTLLHQVTVFDGLSTKGYVLINSGRSPEQLGISEIVDRVPHGHLRTVPATDLALKHVGRPLPNAALLGGFCALTKVLSLDSIESAIMHKFPGAVGERNVAAAREAFALVHAAERPHPAGEGAQVHAQAS